MRGHHMTSQCITWHHTTQEIASHKMKTHQITSHDMTWHLATNHITSPHVTSQPTAVLHRPLQPTTSKQVTTSPPWNGWRLVHSKNSVWASQWLVTLCTFYRQILSLTYSFFSLKLPPPACPALLCTPLWREAHFEVKMLKNWRSQTTFWSWDVEKLHAAVARSTFASENVQNISVSDHFLKLRCWKIARRCGEKHISKSKC